MDKRSINNINKRISCNRFIKTATLSIFHSLVFELLCIIKYVTVDFAFFKLISNLFWLNT